MQSSTNALKSVQGWIIMITGLHQQTQQDDIYDNFGGFGQIKNLHLNLDRKTTFAKGYALLEYEHYETAVKAIESMNGAQIYERPIKVQWAFKKPPQKEKERVKDRRR